MLIPAWFSRPNRSPLIQLAIILGGTSGRGLHRLLEERRHRQVLSQHTGVILVQSILCLEALQLGCGSSGKAALICSSQPASITSGGRSGSGK